MAPRKKPVMIGKPKNSKTAKTHTIPIPEGITSIALPPSRVHHASYHYPLLLDDRKACDGLLSWFKGVEETRSMPWRKIWIDPKDYEGKAEELGTVLGKRAYEVWVSEVSKWTCQFASAPPYQVTCPHLIHLAMAFFPNFNAVLQQTRVSTVIPYFNNWISKWPTVQDLADANHDDVLAVWKGLGYYSRATRLHEGAKAMIAKSAGSTCPLPSKAIDLQEFPGIGRYTAGAVSSIAFGEPEPVLDGNVIRVLSRQLGLYMDGKDKKATDVLWEEADRLIKHVSGLSDAGVSEVPGQWNQALMELGSTVCTPKPQCADCPIQATCRVYSEGQALSTKRQSPTVIPDIEDACTLCELLDTEDLATITEETEDIETPKPTKKRKANTKQSNKISQYFAIGKTEPQPTTDCEDDEIATEGSDHLSSKKRKASLSDPVATSNTKSTVIYCSLFPKKVAKKKATEEECVVCVVELRPSTGNSRWLIEQRPAKGMKLENSTPTLHPC
jgi:A/G-specific adenine glycosylase